jgi:hypothetical protein
MQRAPRPSRAQAIAIPRPQVALVNEWIAAALALAVILGGLLVP